MSKIFSRRNFLKSAALTGSAAALFPKCDKASENLTEKKRELHLGTVTHRLAGQWDVDTIIKNCSETKFEAVELRQHGPNKINLHGVEVDLTPSQRREVKKKFEDSPVKLISMGSAFEFQSDEPEILRKNIEGAKEYIILAHDVGAEGVKVRPNGLMTDKGIPVEQTLEQIGKSAKEIGEFAKNYGVEIRFEIHGSGTNRIPNMKKILDYSECDNVFACWNSNRSDLEDDGLAANFESIKSKIHIAHINELWNEEYPYRKLFELLSGIDYKIYCLAEIGPNADPIRLMKYYRALFLAYQNIL